MAYLSAVEQCARWYVLTARHQHERQIQQTLSSRGWETLMPTYRSRSQWSDRVREIERPLFAGYVFCRFNAEKKNEIRDLPGVTGMVGFGGKLAAIENETIAELRALMLSGQPLCPWVYLKAGDRVRIERGPLRGLSGTLLRDPN